MNSIVQRNHLFFRRIWFKVVLAGFVIALLMLGSLLPGFSGAEETKQATAGSLDNYLQLAEKGNAEAQVKVGDIYRDGKVAPRNVQEAAKWYHKAAQQGLAVAQFKLGEMYRDGLGVTQDTKEALKWFQMAADQGYQAAKGEISKIGSESAGAMEDLNKAIDLIR